jgi:hypothetical protein
MASLTDLLNLYEPETPAGFNLANIALERAQSQAGYDMGRGQLMRNFTQFDLPDLISSQAGRGAFNTSATRNKANRMATGVTDSLAQLGLGYAPGQATLATNALLAQTGLQLGDLM